MNAKSIVMITLATLLAPAPWTLGADSYTNVTEALLALTASPTSQWQAVEYLAKYPDESVPRLMKMVTNQDEGWIYGSAALVRSKDERVVPFYIDLLRNNYYAKEADGTRKEYGLGTKNGCIEMPHIFGGVLARGLGKLGDSRAIPTLKEAAKEGDSEVRKNAYEALYKLGALTLDDLFTMAKKNADPQANIPNIIQGIGWTSIHSDTHFALKVFDRVIAELSEHEYEIAAAHFEKVQCLTILKQYDQAMHECDEVMKFPKYQNLIGQIKAKREDVRRLLDENAEQERKRHNQVPEDSCVSVMAGGWDYLLGKWEAVENPTKFVFFTSTNITIFAGGKQEIWWVSGGTNLLTGLDVFRGERQSTAIASVKFNEMVFRLGERMWLLRYSGGKNPDFFEERPNQPVINSGKMK